jgi:hypothetical protein
MPRVRLIVDDELLTKRVVAKWAADIVRGAAAEALLTPAFRAYC